MMLAPVRARARDPIAENMLLGLAAATVVVTCGLVSRRRARNVRVRLRRLSDRWRDDLIKNVIPFWLTRSIDEKHGGFFTCLDRDGTVLSDVKFHWLQGRQVYMLSRLSISKDIVTNHAERRRLFLAASDGARFLRRAKTSDGRYLFSTTRDGGEAVHYQRKPYTAVFYAMGCLEYYRASCVFWAETNVEDKAVRVAARERDSYLAEGLDAFEHVVSCMKDPTQCGRLPRPSSSSNVSILGEAMCLACLSEQLNDVLPERREDWLVHIEHAMSRVLWHYDEKHRVFREMTDGPSVSNESSDLRLINPGHSIEVSHFLLRLCELVGGSAKHERVALSALEGALEIGWDREHGGGIRYMLDIEGKPLADTTVTSENKLWWPICEAIIAAAYAYRVTMEPKWLSWLERIDSYAYRYFCDARDGGGEWYGYLRRDGTVFNRAKGGNYKGFFHVPRALLFAVGHVEAVIQSGSRR